MGNGGIQAGLFPPVVLEGDKRSACRSICFTCEDSPPPPLSLASTG